jgi:hypothetical protein
MTHHATHTRQTDLFRPDGFGSASSMAMFEHLNHVEADAIFGAIRMQLGMWRLWTEQLSLLFELTHALMVSEAIPDPFTDPSLWRSVKRAALSPD